MVRYAINQKFHADDGNTVKFQFWSFALHWFTKGLIIRFFSVNYQKPNMKILETSQGIFISNYSDF
jgi:hypothetical protein